MASVYMYKYLWSLIQTSVSTTLDKEINDYVLYSRKIWQELYLVDWPQPARIKLYMAEFDLATPRNLPHVHVRLRSLRGVTC